MVSHSSMEPKYIASLEASEEAIWLQQLCKAIGLEYRPMFICCDNHSAIALEKIPNFYPCTKYIKVKLHYMRGVGVHLGNYN